MSVAVVIPCHNYGRYLAECLESVLAQTLRAVEIIVVDDASTDHTRAVAERFADRGVHCLRIEARSPHEARRAGLLATSAPLVCCLDADDRLAPDYLAAAVPLFSDPRVAIAYSPVTDFGDSDLVWNPVPGDIEHSNFIHAGAVFRRAAADRSRAFDRPNEATVEDVEVWKRILRDGWQVARNPAMYYYRKHTGSRSELRPPRLDRLVVSVYLTSAADPQSGQHVAADRWDLVEPWATGIVRQRLRGVIIHDGLSAEFCQRLHAFGIETELAPPIPPDTHANAWRFRLAAEYIAHSDACTAFMTDLFDVRLNDNPFSLLRTDHDLWVGIEPWHINAHTSAGRWMLERLQGTFGSVDPLLVDRPILNAGILGGFRAPLLSVLYDIWATLERRGSHEKTASCMAALNQLVYRRHNLDRIWRRGAPLHSRFKGYETDAQVCFVHK